MGNLVRISDYIPEKIEERVNNIISDLDLQDKDIIPISKICDEYNIAIDYKKYDNASILGALSIDKRHMKKYETNKVIFLNKKLPVELSRYTIAYLLGNYIYVYEDIYTDVEKYRYIKYNIDMSFSIFDKVCNLFALFITMPEEKFMEKFEEFQEEFSNNDDILVALTNHFLVPYQKIEDRASLLFDRMNKKDGKVMKLKI